MARIDALDPRDGAVVRRAAVLGLTFHPRRLADVMAPDIPLPEEGFWDRLSSVFGREADGHVRFKRPALQEAAYASLPFKLRRELHKAVGLRLEHDQGRELDADPAVLSHHFSLAGDHARAHGYAMAAAKRATERFSHADAARLYRRAIEAGRADGAVADPAALAAAWEELGEALRAIGEPADAMRALTAARRLVRDDPIAQARLCDRHAEVAKRSESLTIAVRWLKRGLRCVDPLDDSDAAAWRARIRSNLGGIRARQARWSEAISACQQAISEAEPVGELRALAHACYILDWALVESGRSDEATNSWRALEIYRQLEDPEHEHIVLNNLGGLAYWDGRWAEAVDLYQQAGEASERAGMAGLVAFVDNNIGEILSTKVTWTKPSHTCCAHGASASATRDRQNWRSLTCCWAGSRCAAVATATGLPMLEAAVDELRRMRARPIRGPGAGPDRRGGGVRGRPDARAWKSPAVSCKRTIGFARC